ncbi:Pathoproteinsis-related protein PR-4 [Hibiscus syriacus]|uniref:Pathoproteinsis-related protein PR-4 n=1 Tax=Hibiscus syriacus TaxID=106335 RepID=A0A6A3C2Z0_HIBSY|nr:Pathoproteinsis-related protein PR-4 [Hibiscus syriacus]
MEISVMRLSLLVLVYLVGSAAAQSAENVNAYKVYFKAEENNWDMNAAHVYCAEYNAGEPIEWRSKYYWAAFGDSHSPVGKEACGLCVTVITSSYGINRHKILESCVSCCVTQSELVKRGRSAELEVVADMRQFRVNTAGAGQGMASGDMNLASLTEAIPQETVNAGEDSVDGNSGHMGHDIVDMDGNSLEAGVREDVDEEGGEVVTNTATGDEIPVRIVGPSNSGLDLDEPVFHQLDSDGQGKVVGHLVVNYKFVDCDPKPAGPGETNVLAYYSEDYNPLENNWTYPSHAACYALDGGKPFVWHKRYGWTGYCGKYGSNA